MGKKNKKAAADSSGKLTNKVCEKERPLALHGERMPHETAIHQNNDDVSGSYVVRELDS